MRETQPPEIVHRDRNANVNIEMSIINTSDKVYSISARLKCLKGSMVKLI